MVWVTTGSETKRSIVDREHDGERDAMAAEIDGAERGHMENRDSEHAIAT